MTINKYITRSLFFEHILLTAMDLNLRSYLSQENKLTKSASSLIETSTDIINTYTNTLIIRTIIMTACIIFTKAYANYTCSCKSKKKILINRSSDFMLKKNRKENHAWNINYETLLNTKNIMYSLKINELIQSFQTGGYFFQLNSCWKIPVFELNISFVFHRTWAIDKWEKGIMEESENMEYRGFSSWCCSFV